MQHPCVDQHCSAIIKEIWLGHGQIRCRAGRSPLDASSDLRRHLEIKRYCNTLKTLYPPVTRSWK